MAPALRWRQMSVREIQSELSKLTRDEQLEVAAFLKAQRLAESKEYHSKVAGAHRSIEAGHFVTLEELKALLAKRRTAG